MLITKKGCLVLIGSCLILYSALCSAVTNDEEKPYLYVIYDSTESMEYARVAIADLLGSIDDKLQNNSHVRQNVKFFNFRENIVAQETIVLSTLSQELAAGFTESSKENVLPVLELIASTPELDDAVVLIFTDGFNAKLVNTDTDKLINNLSNRRTQFHYFGHYANFNWCNGERVIALTANNRVIGKTGTESDCEDIKVAGDLRVAKTYKLNKLAKLAYKTGGMVWPISNFKQVGRAAPNAPTEAIDIAAQKLTEILLFKADKSLTATVDYQKKVYIGETVYFEVTANGSDQGVGPITSWRWDFDGDGQQDDLGTYVSKTFNQSGEFVVNLELSNSDIPAVVRNIHLTVKVIE